jgi:deoxyribose-phosphate aldolase|tara:strand:- start:3666 stop:4601 length:936 start_codon:yes stop_codon:yes gene_type:complete
MINTVLNSPLEWSDVLESVYDSKIDSIGLNERVASLATRSIKKDSKLQALNLIVSMCDLTTLEGEDTEGKISQMAAKAIKPDPSDKSIPSAAAVCVYPSLVGPIKEKVMHSDVKVASVSSYFPSGQVPMESKLLDTKYAIDSGADEIDIVINRKAFLEGDYRKVYDEIVALKELCGDVHLKTIIEVGDLKTYENIRKASLISLAAGSDFIKTSTGKLSVGSSRQACYVMSKAVLDFYHMTGIKAGIKVAGGIRDAKDAIRYLVIVNEEMGVDWLSPDMFRFGASSLLDDVLKQIRKLKTGAYQASYYFPRG